MYRKNPQSGFSLVELMIALLLGTLVIAAAGGIFITNRQTFRSTDNLGRVQEGVRTAFELMARDIREAAGNPCSSSVPLANVLNNPGTRWWTRMENWGVGMMGYGSTTAFADAGFGTGAGARLNGTEAIELFSTESPVVTVSAHAPASALFTVNTTAHGIQTGDLVLACSPRQAAMFQASSASGNQIGHAAIGTPGNCTAALGVPRNCGGTSSYTFTTPNTVLARIHAARWYVANNAAGRPALYQTRLTSAGPVAQEIVEGVRSLQFTYLLDGGNTYVNAAGVGGAWDRVKSVRIRADVDGEPGSGTNGQPISRVVEHVASLRNRNP